MDTNLSKFTEFISNHKGEFVLSDGVVYRLLGLGTDEEDYYWILFDGRKIHWHSCCGRLIVLKNKINDDDYNMFVLSAKLNHHDLIEYSAEFDFEFKQNMEKLTGDDKFLTDICWEIN